MGDSDSGYFEMVDKPDVANDPRTWMTVGGQDGGFFALLCLTHGEFWFSDYASWPEMQRAVEVHVEGWHSRAA